MRLIDAELLIEELRDDDVVEWNWPQINLIIKMQPTVDAVPVVHGKWIIRGGKRYCSVCKERACVTRDSEDFWYTVGTNFCPNCGADMREVQNERE